MPADQLETISPACLQTYPCSVVCTAMLWPHTPPTGCSMHLWVREHLILTAADRMPGCLCRRCLWAPGEDPTNPLVPYHDEEWGRPSRDERHLFELLCLEGAQVRFPSCHRMRRQHSKPLAALQIWLCIP